MQARNEILEELRLLSTAVSTISRENPYRVPAGYFDGFPAQVLSLTGEDPSFAGSGDKPLTFSVPDGYFDGFAQNLLDRIKAGQAGSTAGYGTTGAREQYGQTRYVPTAAQDQPGQSRGIDQSGQPAIAAESTSQELARLSPLLNSITRTLPYQVPDDYFEQLSPMLAPLASVRDKPLYTVPENYFAGLPDEIIARMKDEILSQVTPAKKDQPARVISLDRSTSQKKISRQTSWFQPSWLKYSVAAAIAGLIITFGWLRLHNPSLSQTPTKDLANNLSKVSEQDLETYAESNHDHSTTESMNSTATLDINDSDVKSLLGDVPDGDLKQYMEEHGGAVDIATN